MSAKLKVYFVIFVKQLQKNERSCFFYSSICSPNEDIRKTVVLMHFAVPLLKKEKEEAMEIQRRFSKRKTLHMAFFR